MVLQLLFLRQLVNPPAGRLMPYHLKLRTYYLKPMAVFSHLPIAYSLRSAFTGFVMAALMA
jgi:hypothetical protein